LTAVCILRSSCRAGPTGTGRQSAGVSPTGRPAPRVCGWRGGTRPAIKGSDAPRGWPSRAPWTAWPRATQLRQRHSLPCRYRRSEGAFIESNREGGKSRTGQAKGSTMRGVCSGSGPGCGESWVLCRSKSSDKSEQAGGEGLAAREIRIVKGSWQSRRWSASAQRLKSSSSARPIPPPRESDQATRLDGRSVEVTEDPRSAALLPRFTASARRRRSGREGRIVSGRKRGGVAGCPRPTQGTKGGRATEQPSDRARGSRGVGLESCRRRPPSTSERPPPLSAFALELDKRIRPPWAEAGRAAASRPGRLLGRARAVGSPSNPPSQTRRQATNHRGNSQRERSRRARPAIWSTSSRSRRRREEGR
jgi:hypothetical protein